MKRQRPDIVGFSATSFQLQESLEIANKIKEEFPDLPLIWGGVHPTLLPEQTIQHPLVDAICIGEGEQTIPAYLDKLEVGRPPRVRGIWYKDGKRVIKNPPRPLIQDLDLLPFPNWDHWDIENYLKIETIFPGSIPVLASRGCPYDCTFCSNPAIRKALPGKYYRIRSAKNVIDEIKTNIDKYAKIGFVAINFCDENFGLSRKQFTEFCRLYRKEGLHENFPWSCQTRADVITNRWVKNCNQSWLCLG